MKLKNVYENFFNSYPSKSNNTQYAPRLDVDSTENNVIVTAELPDSPDFPVDPHTLVLSD